jgi:hypothetical protein
MAIAFRPYHHPDDYNNIDAFLIHHYRPGNTDGNWIEPMWEYMHFHPMLDVSSLGKIGVWEDDGEIVAVAHHEGDLGEAFFQFHPAYRHLRGGMLDYAERHLRAVSPGDGREYLCAYVNDDGDFLASVEARGSANCGSALLIVNGCSGSLLFAQPNASEPVTCVRRASFA